MSQLTPVLSPIQNGLRRLSTVSSRRKKPSTKEIGVILSKAVPEMEPASQSSDNEDSPVVKHSQPIAEAREPLPEPVWWRKSTIPFREDQYKEIGRLLSELHYEHDVQLTIAEVIRLGLDKMIETLKDEMGKDQTFVDLYEQQQKESQGNEKLKHSKSRGLGQYLAQRGLLFD
jgi:hypothetical protein